LNVGTYVPQNTWFKNPNLPPAGRGRAAPFPGATFPCRKPQPAA